MLQCERGTYAYRGAFSAFYDLLSPLLRPSDLVLIVDYCQAACPRGRGTSPELEAISEVYGFEPVLQGPSDGADNDNK